MRSSGFDHHVGVIKFSVPKFFIVTHRHCIYEEMPEVPYIRLNKEIVCFISANKERENKSLR
jgi:hypothetical protein